MDLFDKIETMANELGIDVNTADEICDGLDEDIFVLSIQLCGDSEMPEVDREMEGRLDTLVSALDTEEIGLIPLISPDVEIRILSALPENCEIRLMME